jgi:hypothetical protein
MTGGRFFAKFVVGGMFCLYFGSRPLYNAWIGEGYLDGVSTPCTVQSLRDNSVMIGLDGTVRDSLKDGAN